MDYIFLIDKYVYNVYSTMQIMLVIYSKHIFINRYIYYIFKFKNVMS